MKNVPVEFCVAEGDVAVEILAEAQSADMLVMGTHGGSGFRHLVLSLAEEADAPLTVLHVTDIPRELARWADKDQVLRQHRTTLDAVVRLLLDREVVEGDEVQRLLESETAPALRAASPRG